MKRNKSITIRVEENFYNKLIEYADLTGTPYTTIVEDGAKIRMKEIKDSKYKRPIIKLEDL